MKEVVILPFQDSLSAGNGTLEQEGMLSTGGKRGARRAGLRPQENFRNFRRKKQMMRRKSLL
ncbi:hypothetical protein [Herbaspirillum huttiense]|uniref:hypothetical protein n=1 Tax=Herbaspirillum huttiense TaxID=863372 RepID=UPI0039AEBFC1